MEPPEDCLGVRTMLDLVMARGAGVFGASKALRGWENLFICKKHLEELGTKWDQVEYNHQPSRHVTSSGKVMLCGFDKKRKLEKMRNGNSKGSPVTADQANANLQKNHFLLHVGVREFTSLTDTEHFSSQLSARRTTSF